MPTNAASNATAPRILSASATSVASASGRCVSAGIVEPPLQDDLSRDFVALRTALPAGARFILRRLRKLGRVPLVRMMHGNLVSRAKVGGERLRAGRHR